MMVFTMRKNSWLLWSAFLVGCAGTSTTNMTSDGMPDAGSDALITAPVDVGGDVTTDASADAQNAESPTIATADAGDSGAIGLVDAGSDAGSDAGPQYPLWCAGYPDLQPGVTVPDVVSDQCTTTSDLTVPFPMCAAACGGPTNHVDCQDGRPSPALHCKLMYANKAIALPQIFSGYCCEERVCARDTIDDGRCAYYGAHSGQSKFYSCPADDAYPGTTGTSSAAPAGCARVPGNAFGGIGYCCAQ